MCITPSFIADARAVTQVTFGPGSGPTVYSNVMCAGNETTITNCSYTPASVHEPPGVYFWAMSYITEPPTHAQWLWWCTKLKQEYLLSNRLNMHINLTCAINGVSKQIHTLHSLTDICCEQKYLNWSFIAWTGIKQSTEYANCTRICITDGFEQRHTLQCLLDMYRYTVFGAQTELSKQGHTLYNLLYMRMDLICAPTGVLLRMHTYHVKAFTAVSLRRDTLQTILWMHMDLRSIQSLDKY